MADLKAICFVKIDRKAPEWIHVMPLGKFSSHEFDGREAWELDNPQGVIDKSLSLGRDMVVDYEHQTDLAPENGEPAPASGWIQELAARADGIWARVDWTAKARKMIEDGEYRYFSPVFHHTKVGRKVTVILRGALTNDPALSLTALATSQNGDPMSELLKKLAKSLGLPEDKADEAAICSAVADLLEQGVEAKAKLGEVAVAAGLKEDANVEEITTALASAKEGGKPDPAKFVSIDQFKEVATSLATLQEQLKSGTATTAVDAAVKNGKVTPAQKEWAMDYATSDPEGFAKYIEAAPVFAPDTKLGHKVDEATGLTDAELETCRVTGVDVEAFKKTKEAQAK